VVISELDEKQIVIDEAVIMQVVMMMYNGGLNVTLSDFNEAFIRDFLHFLHNI
jgi:phosphatidylglycerophosphatase A